MSTYERPRLKKTKEILNALRSVWTEIVLHGDHSVSRYDAQIRHLITHPLRSAHPLAELFTVLLSKKLGLTHPPLKEDFEALSIGELCQVAILRTVAGEDGQTLGQKILPFCSFPSLWSHEGEFHPQETKIAIALLLSAFENHLSSFEYENPYFRALAMVLPKMNKPEGVLDTVQERGQILNLGGSIQNVFVIVGEGVPLGAMKAGNVEIPAFGPQVHPLNDPNLFGITRKIPDARWSALSANNEIWFEYFLLGSQGCLETRFIGLTPEMPVSFVFYVKAEFAKLTQDIYLPKSLRRYCGQAKKVDFENKGSRFSIENINACKMELIPLAGGGCFWDSDFLLSFEIPVHDGRAVFQFSET